MNKQLEFHDERTKLQERIAQIDKNRHPISLVLDGIVDNRNIGGLYRLSDAARLESLWFYKQDIPTNKQIKRISRATAQYLKVNRLEDLDTLKTLKQTHTLVALEVTSHSIPYHEYSLPPKPCLLILGAEVGGVSEEVLKLVDATIHIPMMGVNTSMNVCNAAGIVVYDLLFRNRLLRL